MADNVIHGTGKPRIGISTPIMHSNTILGINGNIIQLTTSVDLTALDSTFGLKNALLWSYTSGNVLTWAKILSYTETGGDFLSVLSWENGVPSVGKDCFIQGYRLDLPYCQRLTEIWSPDIITHKLFNGRIERIKRGFYYSASLDYSGYAHKDTIQLFRQLLRTDKSDIFFYPRSDNTAVAYRVDISPDTEIVLNQIQRHSGHRSWVINLIGIERLTEISVADPASSSGYGDDYGSSYGFGL